MTIAEDVAANGRDTAVRTAIEQVAHAAGEDPDVILSYGDRWNEYVRMGVSIELSIRCWTAETAMSPEDIGMVPHDDAEREAWRSTFKLGRRLMLPETEINDLRKIIGTARHGLYDASFKVLGAWFVSTQKYANWKSDTEEAKVRFLAKWQSILARWDELQAQVTRDYTTIGRENFRRFTALNVHTVWDRPLGTEDEYVAEFVTRCLRKVPTRRYIESSIGFDWKVRYLPLAELLTQETAQQLETARLDAMSEMERDVLAQRADREAIQRDLRQFVNDLKGGLRSRVYDACILALEVLRGEKGKALKNSGEARIPIQRIRTMIEFVNESMIWDDDTELTEQIRRLNTLLPERSSEPADRQAIDRTLTEIAAQSALLLQTIEWPTIRAAGHVGIPDDVVELREVVRTGRQNRLAPVVTPDATPAAEQPQQRRRARRSMAEAPQEAMPTAPTRRRRSTTDDGAGGPA